MHSLPLATGTVSDEPSTIAPKCACALIGSCATNSSSVPFPCEIQLRSIRAKSASEAGRRCRSLCLYGCAGGASLKRNSRTSSTKPRLELIYCERGRGVLRDEAHGAVRDAEPVYKSLHA
eukprot:CAMPEP_0179971634 /NCGR_PEP_ID=MMETSP0983-20121128/36138_1 /TAXON_ID=483367 /ORGANISM="non described non described, Strain CCMP 2436" /LENGTH=119 /DNA_ID=CAMNT_0021886783 /DNA_START=163 /DNA_END=522 /DNA_ORIENTATION=+